MDKVVLQVLLQGKILFTKRLKTKTQQKYQVFIEEYKTINKRMNLTNKLILIKQMGVILLIKICKILMGYKINISQINQLEMI